jgi:hypothetical protein
VIFWLSYFRARKGRAGSRRAAIDGKARPERTPAANLGSLYNRAVGCSYDSEKILHAGWSKETSARADRRACAARRHGGDLLAQQPQARGPCRTRLGTAFGGHHDHGAIGNYIASDRPLTQEEWEKPRAVPG